MVKKKNLWLIIGVVVICTVVVSVLITNLSTKREPDVFKITAILPLSGNFANIGEPKKEAILLAADDINQRGGINGRKIAIVLEDSKGDPKEGVTILQKNIDVDRMKIFYVDLTPIALAAVPIVDKSRVIAFVGSAHPTITDQSKWVFRFFPSGQQEAEMLNDYLVSEGINRIFILYIGDTYGEELRTILTKKFKEAGREVIGSESYTISQKEFRSILAKIKTTNFERIILIGYGVNFPAILDQFNELKIPTNKVIGDIGFIGTPQIAQLSPTLTNNIVFVAPSFVHKSTHLDENPTVQKFVTDYKTKYGKNPNFVAAYAFDAIQVLASALKQSGSDPDNLRKALLSTKDFSGVTGKITMRENGDCATDMMFAKYLDGRIIPLQR